MKRLVSTLATAALTTGLLLVSPAASADAAVPGCPDPEEAVGGRVFEDSTVVLGPFETADLSFEMVARTACLDAYPASIRIRTPAQVIPVEPTSVLVDREQGFTTLRGTYTVDASHLTDADAGEWLFDFAAGDVAHSYAPVEVLRRTTLSFDAGPEPLRRDHRLTFRGRLMAADWEHDRYRGAADQAVRVVALDDQPPGTLEPVAVTRTGEHGRFRVRAVVPGPNRFQAVFPSDYPSPLHFATSRVDAVAARPTA